MDAVLKQQCAGWGEHVYLYAMRTVAAGVFAKQGSQEDALGVLDDAGYRVPTAYFSEEDEAYRQVEGDRDEVMRLWIERDQENIEHTRKTFGFRLAALGRLNEVVPTKEDS